MRRKQRPLTPREEKLAEQFIRDVLARMRLPAGDEDLMQCGWAAFLRVYRSDPAAFSGADGRGWIAACRAIQEEAAQEWRQGGFWRLGVVSLDQPVGEEDEACTRLRLLPAPYGDFQNGVCCRDYLQRLEPDAGWMARRLIRGDSMGEVCARRGWSRAQGECVLGRLRTAMEEYRRI